MSLLFGTAASGADERGVVSQVDPVGTWSCLLYGHPSLGDQQLLLRFHASGNVEVARPSDDAYRPWAPLSRWRVTDNRIAFSDSRTGREFDGELDRTTLGGTWRTQSLRGGWWCAELEDDFHVAVEPAAPRRRPAAGGMAQLLPAVMAMPTYPRQAIREAREGRAVACFIVDGHGAIADVEIIELSDEIFRQPTLDALARSSYRRWGDEASARPGCRSYIYRLDALRNQVVE